MKKILVTQRLIETQDYFEIRDALDVNFALLFKELDFLPILLPSHANIEHYFKQLEIDGVLLTGGNSLYSVDHNELSKHRDIFEKELITYAIKNEIPLFGICRGMQLIGEYFGTTLKDSQNQVNITHTLKVNQNSLFAQELHQLEKVNAFHTYELADVPPEFIISATDTNGSIKAIEHKNKKIFAQMWHPERTHPLDQHQLALLKEFFS